MFTTSHRPARRPGRRRLLPIVSRAGAIGTATLLASVSLTGPAAATGTASPSPDSSASPTVSEAANQAPQLTCGGVMTQAGSTESIRISVADPDGDPVTLSAHVSMFGVQPTVSGHVITYPAPTGTTGQDNFAVLATDGRGGEDYCEIGVLVQAGSASPTPTPTPTTPAPSTPVPSPSTPAPEPTTDAPTPTPAPRPTSDAPAPGHEPAPTPTSSPTSPAPTRAPVAPGPPSDEETTTSPGTVAPAPGTGGGDDSGTETPGEPSGGPSGGPADGAGGTGGDTGGADVGAPGMDTGPTGASEGGSDIARPPYADPDAGTGAPGAGGVPGHLGAVPLRPLADAQERLQDPGSGPIASDGGHPGTADPGPAPSASGPAEDVEASQTRVDRVADTGTSGWLFVVAGALVIALVGLVLLALPLRRRRH